MPWPDVYNEDFSTEEGKKKAKEAIDYAADQFATRKIRVSDMQESYDSFNGIATLKDKKLLNVYKSGNDSKTPYKKYRLGRSKMKQVHGEFLEIPFDPSVFTVNPEAHNRKMNKYIEQLGLLNASPHIEQQRSMGHQVFKGMKMPESEEQIMLASNMKLENELAMQSVLNDKMVNGNVVETLFENWKDLTIASEIFSKIERDNDGQEYLRYVHPKHALFEEDLFDPFLERSPYLGEIRPMYPHEILSNRNWANRIKKEDKEKIRTLNISYNSHTTEQYQRKQVGDHRSANVYIIEVNTYDPVHFKVSIPNGPHEVPYEVEIPKETYRRDREKIQADVKAGRYTIETYDRQVVWELVRVAEDIYLDPVKIEDTIVYVRNGKLSAEYSYTGFLFNTTDGVRISLQDVLTDFERIYDDIRFRINRELKRIKGKVLVFDKAFVEEAKLSNLIEDITEDGIITINSSYAMEQGIDPRQAAGINEFDLGSSQALNVLLAQALDIERIVDKVTGMNDNRQGLTKATTTATTNVNNIEASRSMTYDMFFFMGRYTSRVLMKLVQKTKLNMNYDMDYREFIYDDKTKNYFKITEDFSLDHYGVTITDGQKERAILAKAELFFPQEINAGLLRSKDVIRFYTKSSFAEALKVLDDAYTEMSHVRVQEQQTLGEQQQAAGEQQRQMLTEAREDDQKHDEDMEILRGENKKEQILLQKGLESGIEAQKADQEGLNQPI